MKNIISKLNRIKVRLFYKNHQTGTIYKHNIFYRLLSTIYNNIKYILNNDIKLIIEDIETDYDNSINDIKMELGSLESDIENKCDDYQVEDIIYNEFGNCEDYIKYDELIDIEDKIKALKDEINDNNIISNDGTIERDLLVNEVIKTIINKLENNDNV